MNNYNTQIKKGQYINIQYYSYNSFCAISHNVPAVYDVFLRPIKKNAKRFFGRKKMWRSNTPQRAQARLVYCVARAAEGGEAYTDLLSAVRAYIII
jgi:2-C-methyl-D-erythritol 4-phosphate cytidylyltransferase